jgi:hypothetical protein
LRNHAGIHGKIKKSREDDPPCTHRCFWVVDVAAGAETLSWAREAEGFEGTSRQKVAELRLFGLPREDDAGGELDLEIAYIPLRLQHANDRLPIDLD